MANREIKIEFPEEKMEALSFFMEKKELNIEAELKEHLDKTYEKLVPQQVREFMESKIQPEEQVDARGQSRTRQREEAASEPVRRNQRRTRGQENIAASEDNGNDGTQENSEAMEQEEEQNESLGMSMSM